jgi:hypothetical protein
MQPVRKFLRPLPPAVYADGQFNTRGPSMPARKPQPARSVVTWCIFGGLLGAGATVPIALLLSQFAPVFGGFLERNLAHPFSPARLGLIPVHLFAFGVVGVAIGAGIGAALANISRPAPPVVAPPAVREPPIVWPGVQPTRPPQQRQPARDDFAFLDEDRP